MMKMKKLLAAALALTMLLALAACGSGNSDADTTSASGSAGKTTVTVATSPDFPPFESLDGSEVVGIEVDILQAITEKLDMEMQLEQMDFESVIPGVQAGKFDIGMSGITITADRQKNCDFTQPYFLASQAIVVTPDSDITCKARARPSPSRPAPPPRSTAWRTATRSWPSPPTTTPPPP